jgi:hypothetical protein
VLDAMQNLPLALSTCTQLNEKARGEHIQTEPAPRLYRKHTGEITCLSKNRNKKKRSIGALFTDFAAQNLVGGTGIEPVTPAV